MWFMQSAIAKYSIVRAPTVSVSLPEKPGTWTGSQVNLIGKTASNHPMYLTQLLHIASS
jgi:hypothetical protein